MPSNIQQQQLRDLAVSEHHRVPLLFDPQSWSQATHFPCTWSVITFPDEISNLNPVPGVYTFVVEDDLFDFSSSSGFFYIGKATSLRNRLSTYRRELRIDLNTTRSPHIWTMVNQWDGHLRLYYFETESVEMAESIEKQMIIAYDPYFNKQQPAEVSAFRRAQL